MSSNILIQRICQHCGQEFTAKTTVTKFCSDICAKRAYKARQRTAKIEGSDRQTQQAKTQPLDELKAKPYLSIAETCKLLGISRRTLYRMFDRGELNAGRAGKRVLVRRTDLDRLFPTDTPPPGTDTAHPGKDTHQPSTDTAPRVYDIEDCYTIGEVQTRFGISQTALQQMVKRYEIPRIKKGWYTYVPKEIIHLHLTQPLDLWQQK